MASVSEGLLDLPLDILLKILICLEPKEILALRSCNKGLRQATYDRLLWQRLLQITHKQQEVYLDSRTSYQMTQEELERATLRPHRFISSLLSFDKKDFFKPITTLELPPPQNIDVVDLKAMIRDQLNRYTDALLVLGGRFMFTVYGGRILTLWDLEPQHEAIVDASSNSPRAPAQIAVASATDLQLDEEDRIQMKDWVITHGGKGIYLEIMIMDRDFLSVLQSRRTQICKIEPLAKEPLFETFASRVYEGQYDTCHQGGNLVMLEQESITIWDYENDRSVSWSVGPTDDKTMMTQDGFVMMIDSETGHFNVWTIPPISEFRKGNHVFGLQPCQSSRISIPFGNVMEINVGLPKGPPTVSGIAGIVQSSSILSRNHKAQTELFDLFVISSKVPSTSTVDDDGYVGIVIRHHSTIEIDRGSRMYSTFYGVGNSCILPLARGLSLWDEDSLDKGMELHVAEYIPPPLDLGKPPRQNIVRLEQPPSPIRCFDLCPVSTKTTAVMSNGVVQISQYIQ